MATIDEISIRIDANVSTALQNLRKVQTEATKTEKALKGIDDEIVIDIKADTKAALTSINALDKQLKAVQGADVDIEVNANITKAQTSLRTLTTALSRLEGDRVEVDIRAQINDALASLRDLERNIDRIDNVDINVTADTRGAIAALNRLGRNIDVNVGAGAAGALGNLQNNTEDFTNEFARLSDLFQRFRGGGRGGLVNTVFGDVTALATAGGGLADIVDVAASIRAAQSAQAASGAVGRLTIPTGIESLTAARAEFGRRLRAGNLSESETNDQANAILRLAEEYARSGQAAVTAGAAQRTLKGDFDAAKTAVKGFASSAPAAISSYTGLSTAALGTTAAVVGVGAAVAAAAVAIAAFSISNAGLANNLQLSETSLKAVSQNLVDYYQALELARANQGLFGGTLADNVNSIRTLQLVANRTETDLAQLATTANLLATLNPQEGIAGASFSLSELLSGDYASIVERFNLPRREVQQITEALLAGTISYAEALQDVNTLLARQGVTIDTLKARTETNVAAAERLAAAWERVQIATGKWAAGPLAAATDGLTFLVDRLADVLEGRQGVAATGQLLGQSATFEDYSIRAAAARGINDAALAALPGPLAAGAAFAPQSAEILTKAQFDLAKALQATGLTAEQAANQIVVMTEAEAQAALATEANVQALGKKASAELNATRAAEEAARVEREVTRSLEEGSNARIEAARAQDVFTAARRRDIELALRQRSDLERGRLPVPFLDRPQNLVELNPRGDSSIRGAYDPRAINVINDSIAAFAELEAARLRDANAARVQEQANRAFLDVLRKGGGKTGQDLQNFLQQVSLLYNVQIGQLKELLQLLGLYRQTSFGFLPVFQGSVAGGRPSGIPSSVVTSGPPLYQNPFSRGFFPPGTGGGGKSKADQEAEDLERLRQRILEAERRYRKELLKIEADYYKRSNAARVVFSDQQFSSRAGFYDRLAQFEDQGLRKTLSAQYEQAQIDAGKISDQFGGDVAERFLQASEDAIVARAQRQLGIQTAEAEGRFGDAEYLRGVDRLYRIDEDRRIERSKSTEDSIASDRDNALQEAADSYKETLDGFLTGEEKKLAAVKLVNDALREQGLLGSTSVTGEGGAVSLNIQSTQLDDIKKSIDALALRLPVGV